MVIFGKFVQVYQKVKIQVREMTKIIEKVRSATVGKEIKGEDKKSFYGI